MRTIKALSLTQAVIDWLMNTRQPRILHIFDNTCNLINEHKDVLSIVSQQIGKGPFNLVIKDGVSFADRLNPQSPVSVLGNHIQIGNFIFEAGNTETWNPQPDWEQLHARKNDIPHQLASLSFPVHELSIPRLLLSDFTVSIAAANISNTCALAQKISGLGAGLTPEGDDFILGAVLAGWIIHPQSVASAIASEVTNIAAPLTTSLSAAWLRSAGIGEAGELWHDLFNAFLSADKITVAETMKKILRVGHTSGADALMGFLGVFISYAEQK